MADLYSYTFKPLLDVLLFTRSLSKSMGYKSQLALYSYYLLSATVLRALSPPLALMTAQETGLAGAFRSAHQVRPPLRDCRCMRCTCDWCLPAGTAGAALKSINICPLVGQQCGGGGV